MKNNINVKYFVEFTSVDGKHHYAVHTFNNASRMVDMMRDHKFEGMSYEYKDEDLPVGRFYVDKSSAKGKYAVIDRRTDSIVGVFFDEFEADSFCCSKNGDELYQESL